MYKVLVAEDEPASLQAICSIIEKHCKDYYIAGTAENGGKAWEFIRENEPDLVVSDIKMPNITGVELAKRVREEFPDICFIIISGYQDFEYTQSAIRSGVTDYLLKPVMPDALKRSMDFAAGRIRDIQYRARNRILAKMGRNEAVDEAELKRHFPHDRYYGALIRTNGLPRRFNIDRNREIFSDIDEQYTVFGRDEMESLYLIPSEFMQENELIPYVERIQENHVTGGYHTLIYEKQSFAVSDIREKVRLLYKELDLKTIIGHTQVICLDGEAPTDNNRETDRKEPEDILQKIYLLAGNRSTESLKQEIRQAFIKWGNEERTQLWMESAARDILSILRRRDLITIPVSECEYVLGDIFSGAETIDILSSSLVDIFINVEDDGGNQKAGSREYFDKITEYLGSHLQETLSLQDICATFSISQAYMSKLFRRYTSHSFNKYLTELRMDKAKELFKEDPGRYIREVAGMVGYDDQFYFSRIFRTYVGKSPTEYIKELQD